MDDVSNKPLISGDAGLATALGLSVSTVRRWRDSRLIPYTKVGHRSVFYDIDRVRQALDRLEVQPVTAKASRP